MVRMGSATDSQRSGTGETEWVPLPRGNYKFVLGKPKIEVDPRYTNDDGSAKYRVIVPLSLPEDEYRVAQESVKLEEGQSLSGRLWYRLSLPARYPLGYYKHGSYVPTALAKLWTVAFGAKQETQAFEFLKCGGSPDYSGCATYEDQIAAMENWLGYLEGCSVWFQVVHSPDKKVPGKVWANAGDPSAVGARPGPPEPEYQVFGAGALKGAMSEAASEIVTPEPAVVAVNARAYDELFGGDGGA